VFQVLAQLGGPAFDDVGQRAAGGQGASALRHVGAAAALAAEILGQHAHDGASLDLGLRAGRDGADDGHLALGGAGQHQHAGLHARAQLVGALAHDLRIRHASVVHQQEELADLLAAGQGSRAPPEAICALSLAISFSRSRSSAFCLVTRAAMSKGPERKVSAA
jgi:hypothetical protein